MIRSLASAPGPVVRSRRKASLVAFIVNVPGGVTDAATVLPVQVYIWADSPERGFEEKTAAAIMVLLAFLVAMNAIAIFLRKKFERRW